ncbi:MULTISPECIES: NAD(P)-dependent oxidoreductase [Thiorhodovibrio]|uniref:NAD(P)-dependent oxidoreductase n=1 Tax=Thiorhodovibrio TaxID=61593 RepID=UPI001914CCE8|nr:MULTISPECIES: NAD(P)-binding oxidoreductase [Thiorhodovibrio]MBK5968527.1 epimerase [Thiorhodovibrio winogradskyi]WPL12439.1 putative sugar epimerase YhfK [Thiorhodovibrio litoralis]
MHIALFGATGGTGREVLAQALTQGHRIQALVRDPTSLPAQDGLRLIPGDVLDATATRQCITGTDAVICVLGSKPKQPPIEARGTAVIVEAMQASAVRRLIAVTSMGVGDSRRQLNPLFRWIMDLSLKAIMQAKAEQEQLIRASGLDWTIVRPGGLTDGPRTGTYRHGLDKSIKGGRISRADVAEFVLAQLDDRHYWQKTPAVT